MMHQQKWIGPAISTFVTLLIGVYVIIQIHHHWTTYELTLTDQPVREIDQQPQPLDLKSIIHEAEKHVVQIEGHWGDTILTGSGFVYNDQGDIITNAHVINHADFIYVKTAHAHVYPAAIVGIGEDIDVAVIRVPQLADDSYLKVEKEMVGEIGDEVIALGSPHGFQNTVTLGIISGTDRNFSLDGYEYNNLYQISAQITHGNSGGPLISRLTGHVIGINSVGSDDGTLGFSIPIHEVIDVIEEWSKTPTSDLNFTSMSNFLNTYDPEQLREDAEYLIDYFFDGIKFRDYINAYTLLGSHMQSELSYANFRENFTQIVNLSLTQDEHHITADNNVEAQVTVTVEEKSHNENDTETNVIDYTFVVGLENDQLKILKIEVS